MSAPSIAPTLAAGTASRSRPATAVALAVVGGALALNSLALGSQTFFDPRPYSQIAGTPVHDAYYLVLFAGLVILSQVVGRLDRVPGRSGRTLPSAAAVTAGLGVGLDAASRYVEAFVVPYLAERAPELLDDTSFTRLQVAMVASWSLAALALSAVGVIAFRRRLVARGVAAALVVVPLTAPVIGPLTWALTGTVLLLVGLDLARHRSFTREAGTPDPAGS